MNARRRLPTSTLAVAGLLGLAVTPGLWPQHVAATEPPAPAPAEPHPALVSLCGPDSAITEGPAYHRIVDADAWKALYLKHLGDRAANAPAPWLLPPDVDFSRCMVLAIFRGRSTNCNGEFLVSLDDRPDDLLIRFDSHTFQTASFTGEPDRGVPSTPYGIFILPRSDKPIVLEENVQGLIGHPPVWKQQYRFPALTQ
ncbi:MAG: hypothetical protein KF745_06610 [Phycisphaeraceae bacterium]|nr:hypothetical protein [Phycisphaeraceae bacterium]